MNAIEIKKIVDRQRSWFETGATLDVEKRIVALKRLKGCILKYETKIHEAIEQDLGKSGFESYM